MAEECGAGSVCIQRVSDTEPSVINAVDLASLIPGKIRSKQIGRLTVNLIDIETERLTVNRYKQTDRQINKQSNR